MPRKLKYGYFKKALFRLVLMRGSLIMPAKFFSSRETEEPDSDPSLEAKALLPDAPIFATRKLACAR